MRNFLILLAILSLIVANWAGIIAESLPDPGVGFIIWFNLTLIAVSLFLLSLDLPRPRR